MQPSDEQIFCMQEIGKTKHYPLVLDKLTVNKCPTLDGQLVKKRKNILAIPH